jgi:hypothetical protein
MPVAGFPLRGLDTVVKVAKSFLVIVAGFLGLFCGVLNYEVGAIPFFHSGLRVVRSSQRFLGTDGVDPAVHGLLIGLLKLVQR